MFFLQTIKILYVTTIILYTPNVICTCMAFSVTSLYIYYYYIYVIIISYQYIITICRQASLCVSIIIIIICYVTIVNLLAASHSPRRLSTPADSRLVQTVGVYDNILLLSFVNGYTRTIGISISITRPLHYSLLTLF